VHTPVLHKVASLGIFSEAELPWAVYLLDLRTICELVEFPSQLIHYLDRRLKLHSAKNVEVSDELDWFGHYLHEGLSMQDLQRWGNDRVQLATYTTAIDDYFMYQSGQRQTAATRPSQHMPWKLREIIRQLEAEHASGHVAVVCHLLDMDDDARKGFVKSFDKIRRKSGRDGGEHGFTMVFPETALGLCAYAGMSTPLPELIQHMRTYCVACRSQTGVKRWVGLASHVALEGPAHGWIMLGDD